MKAENTKKQIKFDFSNAESQKLFEEFTILLSKITKYVKSQEEEIISGKKELIKVQEELTQVQYNQKELLAKLELVTGGRYMIKAVFKKIIDKFNRLSK